MLRAAVDLRPKSKGEFPKISETESSAGCRTLLVGRFGPASADGRTSGEDFVLGIASASNSLARLTLSIPL